MSYIGEALTALMKCITPEEGQMILQEIHTRACGSHIGAKSLVGKTYEHGFFWLTAMSDAESIIRRCEGCQFFPTRNMCRLISCRPYPLPGLFPHGG
jgi:hypothetical protein